MVRVRVVAPRFPASCNSGGRVIVHLTAIDYSLWLIEFIIELAILVIAFRKSLFTLSAYATARAIFDVLTFGAVFFGSTYDLAFWAAKPLEYFFQIVLAVTCVGYMVRGKQTTVRLTVITLCMVATMGVMLAYGMAPLKYDRMIDIEMSLNLFLAIGLAVGLKTGYPERAWKQVALGLIILGCTDTLLGLLTTSFRSQWDVIARMYPVCEIAALGLLLWAAKGVVVGCSIGLGHKIQQVDKVSVC